MSVRYKKVRTDLIRTPRRWLVTGSAGFIGSHLLEELLMLNQTVIGLDNFATGHQHNLDEVHHIVGPDKWRNFHFVEGDICDLATCRRVVEGSDYVLHQAALGSVPRSIENPVATNTVNVGGFLNMLVAAMEANISSFTYAASSSTYGDHEALPKSENVIGNPLSPYAVTKYVNELYAGVFARTYGFNSIGLRYFNVFGKRQDPNGAYAAVIPKWISAMINNDEVRINGDGGTSRDFCYIENAVQANILAATAEAYAVNEVYNVACNARTSLNDLIASLKSEMARHGHHYTKTPIHGDFRAGDVMHSEADISKGFRLLGFEPSHSFAMGIEDLVAEYMDGAKSREKSADRNVRKFSVQQEEDSEPAASDSRRIRAI